MILNDKQLIKIKEIELEMLTEFVAICSKMNLTYYLVGGTLLGAVRHKGFIPWDDDIDVAMPREDYEKFISRASVYLPKHIFLQNYKTDNNMIFPFTKLRNSNTAYIEKRSKYVRMNQGVWIDIFPLDYYEMNKVKRKAEDWLISIINMRIGMEQYFEDNKKRSRIKQIARDIFFDLIKKVFPTLTSAVRIVDKIHASTQFCNIWINKCGAYSGKEDIPVDWFGEGCIVEFENMKLRGPTEYDKYLRHIYGDYMTLPPLEKQVPVHDIEIIDLESSYSKYL